MISCSLCGIGFEPIRSRWLCPACGFKESCCEGEPLTCTTPPRAAGLAEHNTEPHGATRLTHPTMIGPPRT